MKKFWIVFSISVLLAKSGMAQIPVEVFAGNNSASVDLMFFKFFQKKDTSNSPWLFFNRNRATIDYRMMDTTYLPTFASVNAISYNAKQLKGLAPVVVGQFLTWNARLKTGIQYAWVKPHFTLFSWSVVEARENPNLDYYLLLRYQPRLNDNWRWFFQGESLNIFPTISDRNMQFYQRARIGLGYGSWQFGVGVDVSQIGRESDFQRIINAGVFLRHEFK